MDPRLRIAGVAGILAGLGLALELGLFLSSGWTPGVFADPAAALAFLEVRGAQLRAAVFAGAINLAFTVLLVAGLAAKCRTAAPTSAAATLYFGLVGSTGHGLVPLGLWLGVPMFVGLAHRDPQVAAGAWGGFALFLEAAGGLGYLFLGLSMLAAGWAAVSAKALPALLGWVGLVAGAATVVNVLARATPLDGLAGAAFLPALLLTIVFRVWSGVELWRGEEDPCGLDRRGPAATARAPVTTPEGSAR
jgi:hypothetical protein